MSNSNDQTFATNSQRETVTRLAIFENTMGRRLPLGVLTVFKEPNGTWTLECKANEDSARDRMGLVVNAYAARQRELREAGTPIEALMFSELADMFRAAGYEANEIPADDHQIHLQIDAESGRMVATQSPMNEIAALDEDMGRRIVESIAKGLRKPDDDLANTIVKLLDQNDTQGALEAVRSCAQQGLVGLLPSQPLLDALIRFDVDNISSEDRRLVREQRAALASRLNRYDIAGKDAEGLLGADDGTSSPEKIVALRTTVALGAIARGNRETGLSMLYDLLDSSKDLSAEARAWVWRNISMTLDDSDPEALNTAQLSADAFLQAGNKHEAGKSLMRLATLLMNIDPREAIDRLDEMISLLEKESIYDRKIRAAALHARANRLSQMHLHKDAYRDACEAVELGRGLLGDDNGFVSSLHLAAQEADYNGEVTAVLAFEQEALELTNKLSLSHFQLAERAYVLTEVFDAKESQAILQEAEASNNFDVMVCVRVLRSSRDQSLSDAERLEILEEVNNRAKARNARPHLMKPIQSAMGQTLARQGKFDRAEKWFREVLAGDAYDNFALPALLQCLWEQKKWGEAATLLQQHLHLKGPLPGFTYALGKSQFHAGLMSESVTTLTKVINAPNIDENLRKNAEQLRELALQSGGTVQSPALRVAQNRITREQFENALEDFARYIANSKRMRFWAGDGKGGHKWVTHPERQAQDLLHTFFKARFDDHVEIFEELGTGAGRLDLYVKFEGGLSIIVELKMCGGGYSSAYAASGEEQIVHYMENRETNLGYLVVFDGRKEKFGQPLLESTSGPHTIVESIIDVRASVKVSKKL